MPAELAWRCCVGPLASPSKHSEESCQTSRRKHAVVQPHPCETKVPTGHAAEYRWLDDRKRWQIPAQRRNRFRKRYSSMPSPRSPSQNNQCKAGCRVAAWPLTHRKRQGHSPGNVSRTGAPTANNLKGSSRRPRTMCNQPPTQLKFPRLACKLHLTSTNACGFYSGVRMDLKMRSNITNIILNFADHSKTQCPNQINISEYRCLTKTQKQNTPNQHLTVVSAGATPSTMTSSERVESSFLASLSPKDPAGADAIDRPPRGQDNATQNACANIV